MWIILSFFGNPLNSVDYVSNTYQESELHIPSINLVIIDFIIITLSVHINWFVVHATFIHAEFPKPGEVEVVVKIRHEESSLFPKFKLHVQSPIEAIYHNVPISKASTRSAVLATVLAYLLHGDESQRDRETRSHIDIILCNILQSLSDVPHWDLTSILSGMSVMCTDVSDYIVICSYPRSCYVSWEETTIKQSSQEMVN